MLFTADIDSSILRVFRSSSCRLTTVEESSENSFLNLWHVHDRQKKGSSFEDSSLLYHSGGTLAQPRWYHLLHSLLRELPHLYCQQFADSKWHTVSFDGTPFSFVSFLELNLILAQALPGIFHSSMHVYNACARLHLQSGAAGGRAKRASLLV